ncbi:MAG TPA: hypothetical protein VGQ09_21260 [Chitinophagaceae bacterium]|nr:hypothetical protein [Chitinophagaceae bacterium]
MVIWTGQFLPHGLITVKPQTNISAITKTSLIIIPSMVRDYQKAMKETNC